MSRDFRVREMRKHECALLENFLYLAIFVPEGDIPPPRNIVDRPELRVYVDGFGEGPADRCFVAESGETVVGAAWARIMDDYGHIDDETPSLAIAVLPEWRGKGVGSALMEALLSALTGDGWQRVSLSVQRANRAARLYRRQGFQIIGDRGNEWLMARPLT